jgi:hypothetical protein
VRGFTTEGTERTETERLLVFGMIAETQKGVPDA